MNQKIEALFLMEISGAIHIVVTHPTALLGKGQITNAARKVARQRADGRRFSLVSRGATIGPEFSESRFIYSV